MNNKFLAKMTCIFTETLSFFPVLSLFRHNVCLFKMFAEVPETSKTEKCSCFMKLIDFHKTNPYLKNMLLTAFCFALKKHSKPMLLNS